jgi:hypothetical protein
VSFVPETFLAVARWMLAVISSSYRFAEVGHGLANTVAASEEQKTALPDANAPRDAEHRCHVAETWGD